jgi:hypothetical protein
MEDWNSGAPATARRPAPPAPRPAPATPPTVAAAAVALPCPLPPPPPQILFGFVPQVISRPIPLLQIEIQDPLRRTGWASLAPCLSVSS